MEESSPESRLKKASGRTGKLRRLKSVAASLAVLSRDEKQVAKHRAESQATRSGAVQLPPLEEDAEGMGQKLVKSHPLFLDTSKEFKSTLSLHVKRFEMADLSEEEDMPSSIGLFEPVKRMRKLRVLLSEGCEVPDNLNGLLLTFPEDGDIFEQLYNRVGLGDSSEADSIPCVCGQEVALKLCTVSPFTVRRRKEPARGFYFIHADELDFVMLRFAKDGEKLRKKVYQAASQFMKEWLVKNYRRMPMKLFANMPQEFTRSLVTTMDVNLYPAGAHITTESSFENSCLYVHSGEAEVTVRGEYVCKLSQASGSRAWESWWGALEVGGTALQRLATVTATTDCMVWELGYRDCEDLRLIYPSEINFFDKVALKHLSMLSPFSSFSEISLFDNLASDFQIKLATKFENLFLPRHEYIFREGEQGDTMFVIMHGQCSMLRGYSSEASNHLHPGIFFGGLAVLNVNSTRLTTVRTDCVCHLRSLTRISLLNVLQEFPDQEEIVKELVQVYSQNQKVAVGTLESASKAEGGFSKSFINLMTDSMHERPYFMKQLILQQGADADEVIVLVHGVVDIEVNGTNVASVSAPAIFGEMALLEKGSKCTATVRAGMMAECMVLPTASSATEKLRSHTEDMEKLRKILQRKLQSNENVLSGGAEAARRQQSGKGLFSNSSQEFVKHVTQYFVKKIYLPGHMILAQGEESRQGFQIHQGTALVEINGQQVARVGPGDFVGEGVILGLHTQASATIRAQTRMVTFAIDKDTLRDILALFPEEKAKLLALIKARLNQQHYSPERMIGQLNIGSKILTSMTRARKRAEEARIRAELEKAQEEEAARLLEEARARKKRFPSRGYREGRRWVDQKRQALQAASRIRWDRLRENGRIATPLPPTHPLRVTKAGAGTPWAPPLPSEAAAPGGVVTSQMRIRKTAFVYGRSVWQESFRTRKMLAPIRRHQLSHAGKEALNLEEAINAAESSLQLHDVLEEEEHQEGFEEQNFSDEELHSDGESYDIDSLERYDDEVSTLSHTPDLTLLELMPDEAEMDLESTMLEEHAQDLVGSICQEAIGSSRLAHDPHPHHQADTADKAQERHAAHEASSLSCTPDLILLELLPDEREDLENTMLEEHAQDLVGSIFQDLDYTMLEEHAQDLVGNRFQEGLLTEILLH